MFGENKEEGISPLGKIEALIRVYFLKFESCLQELKTASGRYEQELYNLGLSNLAERSHNKSTDTTTLLELYKPYLRSVKSLQDAIKKYAEHEFQ